MTLELLSPSSLSVKDDGDDGVSKATIFDLNTLLGNKNGSFDSAGVWFTASARNVTLRGRVLCAELQNLQRDWEYNEISILSRKSASSVNEPHELFFDKSELAIEQAWSDNVSFAVLTASSFDECRNVRLIWPSTVVALCRIGSCDDLDVQGEYRKRRIDLKELLGNNNGQFDEDGKNFVAMARNVRILGTQLIAELRTIRNSWREDSIDLTRLIVCKNGQLLAVKAEREAASVAETSQRSTEYHKMLAEKVSETSTRLYAPLSSSGNVLRLCYVLPGNWDDSLRCYMVTVGMDNLQYRCLSYCWGAASATESMSINGHRLSVGQNLAHALRHLRARNMHSAVWIDAICINQQDNKEKSHQVSRMGEIFSGALEVLIWLGDDYARAAPGSSSMNYDVSSNNALIDALEHLAKGIIGGLRDFAPFIIHADGTIEYGRYDRLVSAVEKFLDSEWFTRAWTIQELMLTDHPLMLYGGGTIRWETLRQAHIILDHFFRSRGAVLAAGEQEDSSIPGVHIRRPLILALRRFVERLWHFRDIKQEYDRTQSLEKNDVAYRRQNALQLLQKCRSQKASDPRDKLFAFYNIAKVTFGNLWPDYTLETVEIYKHFTFANIVETSCFDIWALKDAESEEEPGQGVQNLPSWVIDWSRRGTESLQPGFRYRFKLDHLQTCTTPQSRDPLARQTLRGNLLVEGYEFAQVVAVTNTAYTSFSLNLRVEWESASWKEHGHVLRDWSSFLSSMFASEAADSSTVLNYLWRIMIGKEVYRREDGSVIPGPVQEEKILAMLHSDKLFRDWWSSHVGTWPGYERKPGSDADFVERPDLAPLTGRCRIRAEDRRLCILSGNGLGLVPKQCRPHDRICLIRGSNWPVVLRPDNTASPEHLRSKHFALVGTCLVDLPDLDWKSCGHLPSSEIVIS